MPALESGFKISDLNNIPVTGSLCKFKNKIALDNTFILSYSHTIYGTNYNTNNYKIPLNDFRNDIKGYIGVESLVAPWSEQLKLWHGNWNNAASFNKSYTHVWNQSQIQHEHYSPEKFNDLENSYFIIKDAPFPFESGELHNRVNGEKQAIILNDCVNPVVGSINVPIAEGDPYPESNKIITKSYIDERLASKRIIEVLPEFSVRDYDCTYIIRSEDLIQAQQELGEEQLTIKITYPDKFNERALHNKLAFTLMLEGIKNEDKNVWVPALTKDVNWILVDNSGKELKHIWLNDGENQAPSVVDEYLYGNAQYLIFRFESITNEINSIPLIETIDGIDILKTYKITADFDIFILCENLLYRKSGIERVNGIPGTSLDVISSSININTRGEGSRIILEIEREHNIDIQGDDYIKVHTEDDTVQLSFDASKLPSSPGGTTPVSVNISSSDDYIVVEGENNNFSLGFNSELIPTISSNDNFISVFEPSEQNNSWKIGFNTEELNLKNYIKQFPSDGEIDIETAYNTIFYASNITTLNLNIDANNPTETISFGLLYKAIEDGQIGAKNIFWAMSPGGESPLLKANRLYYITFTYFPAIEGFMESQLIGRINWFKNI